MRWKLDECLNPNKSISCGMSGFPRISSEKKNRKSRHQLSHFPKHTIKKKTKQIEKQYPTRCKLSSFLPVVPHKAVAEVSKIGHYRRGELLWSVDGRAIHWWTEKWLELCFLEWLQCLQWSPHPQLLDVVWCSAAVVVAVVSCNWGGAVAV